MSETRADREYRARAAQKRDELTEKLIISWFGTQSWDRQDDTEACITYCRKLARDIQESHEGEI